MNFFRFSYLAFLVAAFVFGLSEGAPIVTRTDKAITVDVSPFFKMNLLRDGGGKMLDIDVLSGLVKVGYDRLPGQSPNVDVEVFGLGSSRKRISNPDKGIGDQGFEIQ